MINIPRPLQVTFDLNFSDGTKAALLEIARSQESPLVETNRGTYEVLGFYRNKNSVKLIVEVSDRPLSLSCEKSSGEFASTPSQVRPL